MGKSQTAIIDDAKHDFPIFEPPLVLCIKVCVCLNVK